MTVEPFTRRDKDCIVRVVSRVRSVFVVGEGCKRPLLNSNFCARNVVRCCRTAGQVRPKLCGAGRGRGRPIQSLLPPRQLYFYRLSRFPESLLVGVLCP